MRFFRRRFFRFNVRGLQIHRLKPFKRQGCRKRIPERGVRQLQTAGDNLQRDQILPHQVEFQQMQHRTVRFQPPGYKKDPVLRLRDPRNRFHRRQPPGRRIFRYRPAQQQIPEHEPAIRRLSQIQKLLHRPHPQQAQGSPILLPRSPIPFDSFWC